MKQFDIYWVSLDPTIGAETKKTRPCVVLSSDAINASGSIVQVAPILPNHKKYLMVVNITPSKVNGLDKERNINIRYMRGVDGSRLGRKQGRLEKKYHLECLEGINDLFALYKGRL